MRVLVVEDEPLLAMLLEENLAELGYELVGCAATVPQALSMLDEHQVDCALLDYSLGNDTTSLPVAQKLRNAGKPFYYLTGHSHLGDDLPIHAPMLTKPVSMDALQLALRKMAAEE